MKNLMMRTFITLLTITYAIASGAQPSESMHQRVVASQVAAYMDQSWEAAPDEGLANIRFLVLENGKPLAGITSTHGRFELYIHGNSQYSTGFNPNSNGRYVFEDIEPGTYQIVIKGAHERAGFEWTKEEVVLEKGNAPVIEIETHQ